MKRTISICICLLMSLTLLIGCSAGDAGFREKVYTADASQVQAIRIDVRDRKVEIEPSDSEDIAIIYCESSKEGYDLSVSDSTLVMAYRSDREWTDFIGSKTSEENRIIRLRIPQSALSSLSIATTNEDVTLPALTLTGSLSIDVNNGNISFEKLDVGSAIELKAKDGDVSGTIVGGYDDFTITTSVKKGESNLPEQMGSGEKTLNVSANNGDIQIQMEK